MGHSVGQYFSMQPRHPALPRPQLPPFSHAPAAPAAWPHWPSAHHPHHHHQHDMQQKVTGADLPLPHSQDQEDNVGSILRQVYHTEHTADFAAKTHPLGQGAEAYPMEYSTYDSFLYFNA